MSPVRGVVSVLLLTLASACAHVQDVQTSALLPHYLRPTPTTRIAQPLLVVYDPSELRNVVPLIVPSHFPGANLLDAPSLVTVHLRSGLESLFEHVSVTTDPQQAPAGALLCTVRFIAAGLAMAPGGNTLVGTLEWSVTLTRQGQPETIYSWGERTVGTREGAGAFGSFDPAPVVQGAVEASLRAMLKDMNDKGLPERLATPTSQPG